MLLLTDPILHDCNEVRVGLPWGVEWVLVWAGGWVFEFVLGRCDTCWVLLCFEANGLESRSGNFRWSYFDVQHLKGIWIFISANWASAWFNMETSNAIITSKLHLSASSVDCDVLHVVCITFQYMMTVPQNFPTRPEMEGLFSDHSTYSISCRQIACLKACKEAVSCIFWANSAIL